MGFRWVDNFVGYGGPGNPVIPGVWRGSLPMLESGGRDGTPWVRWHNNSMLRRNTGAPGGFAIALALRLEYSPVIVGALADRRILIGSTLTSKNWIIGAAWNGFAYFGVVATMDGALHLVRGEAFGNGPSTQDVEFFGSSKSGVLPFTGLSILEVRANVGNPGRVQVLVNGTPVLDVIDYNKPVGNFCDYVGGIGGVCDRDDSPNLWPNSVTDIVIGGPTRGSRFAGDVGWTGYIDSVWGFDNDGFDDIGRDLKVETLTTAADGAFADSIIIGDAPKPTRWESIEDALVPDHEDSAVMFDDSVFPQRDEYQMANLVTSDPEIFGVHALAISRRAQFGTAALRMSLHDGTNTVDGGLLRVQTPSYRSQGYGFPLAPDGGEWTLADVNNLRLRLAREA